MLLEFGAETMERTAVSTGAESFDDQSRGEFEIVYRGDDIRRKRGVCLASHRPGL
jgi:hypothetical protein